MSVAESTGVRHGAPTVTKRTEPTDEWQRDDASDSDDTVSRWTYASPEGWTHAVAIADTGGVVDRFRVWWETADHSHETYRHVSGERRHGPNVDRDDTEVTAVAREDAKRVARRFRREIIGTTGHAHLRRDEIVAAAGDVDRLTAAEYLQAWEDAAEERARRRAQWREERARIHAAARREWDEEQARRRRLLAELEQAGVSPVFQPEIVDEDAYAELVDEYLADEITILAFEERVEELLGYPE